MNWVATTPDTVRCIDCRHWRGSHGWCATARKNANSARAARRCKHFERKPTALDHARAAVEAMGLLDAVDLVELGPRRIGARVKPGIALETETLVLDTINAAMRRAARGAGGDAVSKRYWEKAPLTRCERRATSPDSDSP